MKQNRLAWLLTSTISAAMLFLSACTPPNDAGKDVLPNDDLVGVHYTDSFSLDMRTIVVDSVTTANLSRSLFGNYVDEQFGHIYAETYIQPRLTGSNVMFGTNPAKLALDSIVLTLDLLDFYGRYNDPIPLEIFRITQAFDPDSAYSSESSLAADTSYDLARGYELDFGGLSGFYDFVNIRLDDSLGNTLLFGPSDSLSGNGLFTQFFKGLLIRSKPVSQTNTREPGGIFAFDPRSSKTALTLYYKDSTAAKTYTFSITDASARFHRIERTDEQGRLLEFAANNGGTAAPYACVQAGALVKLFVAAPSMGNLDPAGINRADLELLIDPDMLGSENRFTPPDEVFLFVANEDGTKEYNRTVVNSSASYNSVIQGYSIPITQTLQQILAGRLPNNGFIIVPGNNGVTLDRAVFAGPGHPSLKPRVKVVYTELPGQGG